MLAFSREGILMVPGADRVLRELAGRAPAYVVSTSYCQYVRAVCEAVGFPPEQAFCTRIDLDDYAIPEDEVPTVRAWAQRILSREPIELPDGASGPGDLSERDRATVMDLDSMFWEEMPELAVYGVVEETRTVGGPEKAVSVGRAADREGADLSDVVYVGDSITDVEAFRTVRRGGGLAVSFNGNGWAVREADLALVSERADIVLAVVRDFLAEGHDAVRGRVWGDGSAETVCQWTRGADVEALVERSERVRKQVRGQVVGGLG